MLSKLDYSYNNEESLIHRLNPVVKIFGLIVYLLVCLLKFNYLLFIVSIGLVFTALLLSNIKIIKYLKIVWKLKYLIIIIYAYMLHKDMAFIDINIIVFKIIFLVLYIMMIYYSTTKEDLGKGSAKVLDVFNLIGISFKKISSFITNIFAFIEIFFDTYEEVITNLEVKGKVYGHSNILDKYKLILKNFKLVWKKSRAQLKKRKKSMEYKLYKGNVKSQYKYRNKLCIFDYIFIIVNIGMLVFYILEVR